jgi:hypothetical protein
LKEEESLELIILASSLMIDTCNNLDEFKEANSAFDSVCKEQIDFENLNEATSYLYSSHAETLWKTGDSENALIYAWKAIELNKKQEKASWLIREIEGKFSKESKYFRIMIQGIWPQPIEGDRDKPGFYTSYDVIADTLEEAMAYIKRFEPRDTHHTLKVEENEILGKYPRSPQGVYDVCGYLFFTE